MHSDEFRRLAADFSRGVLLEARAGADDHPFAPLRKDIFDQALGLGFFAVNLPGERGGLDLPPSSLCPILEEMSIVDAGPAAAVFTNAAALEIIDAAGWDTLRAEPSLPVAFTPFHHPDEANMPVTDPNGILRGRAEFVTLAGISSLALIPARDTRTGAFGYYLIDTRDPRVRISEPLFTLGLRSCPSYDLDLDGVPAVPAGGPAAGHELYRHMACAMAPAAASISIGIMEGSRRDAAAYAAERYQGWRFIDRWHAVRLILAGMAERIECARSALAGIVDGEHGTGAAALALSAGEDACRVTSDGVQVLGGNGYMKDYFQEKRMRDAAQARFLLGGPYLRRLELAGGNPGGGR